VKTPSPAIVAQSGVRRLPRWGLMLLCAAYVLPGFLGRDPWRPWDMAALGQMLALVQGDSPWWQPHLLGSPPELDGLLPFWLGAWSMAWAPAWISPLIAARLPFIAVATLVLVMTWNAIDALARSPQAQPVSFAFGGEARPKDYARTLADAGLLALVATLGLALPLHETTPMLVQLGGCSALFMGVAFLRTQAWPGSAFAIAGLFTLALSGAPSLAILLGLAVLCLVVRSPELKSNHRIRLALLWLMALVLLAALAQGLDLWRWRLRDWHHPWADVRSLMELMLWFTWPCWPLALWSLWSWRRQWGRQWSLHVVWPLTMVVIVSLTSIFTTASERTLLLALPAYAALASFALPTLQRSVTALIDWFTLLFFSGCGIIIWVVWLAMQTGWPPQPAANVARLAPGFAPSFEWIPFLLALMGTASWCWLVHWRVGRHRTALWKSLVLPSAGAALCWLLLMTLWLPLLNYARSYLPLVNQVKQVIPADACMAVQGLTTGQLAALKWHGPWKLHNLTVKNECPWLLVDAQWAAQAQNAPQLQAWSPVQKVNRPTRTYENLLIYRRNASAAENRLTP
jgi:hypothetical protein